MPKSVNRITLMGHVGKDPEIREGDNARAVIALATTEWHKLPNTGKDEFKENTTWHRIYAWGNLVEKSRQISKGDFIYVEGKLESYSYEDDAGKKNTMIYVKARELIPCISKKETRNQETQKPVNKSNVVPF